MISEIEKKFFELFEIRQNIEIAPDILLKLICVISKYQYIFEDLHCNTVDELKIFILNLCVTQELYKDKDTKLEIKSLFL